MSDPFTAEWLREIAPEVVDTLRQASEPNFFGDGSIVYPLDGEPPWLWGVQSGYVRYFATYDEVGPTLCHIFGPGSWFGIARMARRNPTTEEARAATDTTLVRVHKSTFRQLATRHPALWEAAIQLVAMVRVLSTHGAMDLTLRKGNMRLAAVLLRLSGYRANTQEAAPWSVVHASQKELAELANISLSRATDYLAVFADAGMIELKYRRIVVTNPTKLRAVITPGH
jgi:CRP/FNR family transcriptional regulator, cyclic AMP receptor protein